MPLEKLVIENGLTAIGTNVVTGSIAVTEAIHGNLSGSFSGSFQGNGTNVTGATAIITNMPAGTVLLIYADEVGDSGTTATTVKTYTLPANSYSRIIIESGCGFRGNAASNSNANFNIVVGGVTKRTKTIEGDNTGGGDQQEKAALLKYSEAITAGATIEITTTTVALGTWEVDALRVYGVL